MLATLLAGFSCLGALALPVQTNGSQKVSIHPARGEVRCKVILRGEDPGLPEIAVDKNVEHCGATLRDPVLRVGTGRLDGGVDGALAGAVVYLEAANLSTADAREGVTEISIRTRGCQMEPRVQTATGGVQLLLRNGDPVTHNPHGWSSSGRTVFNVTLLDDRLTIRRTLREAGLYRIDCDTHSWMHAYVHVFDHPFHAVTDERGEAILKDVPAGSVELVVWHEVLGERRVPVAIEAGRVSEVTVELELRDVRPPELKPKLLRPWPRGPKDARRSE